jgi:microcystin-dependent protein
MTDLTPYASLTKPTVGGDSSAWGDMLNDDLDLIDAFLRQIMPAGAVVPYAGASAPTGFLLCNGAAVSRTTYAALFAAIGTAFGAGDGSSTFNVPDMTNRFAAGAGTTPVGGVGGSASLTGSTGGYALTVAELPAHSHSASDSGHAHADAGHSHGLSASPSGVTLNEPPTGHSHANSSGGQLIPMQTGLGNNLGGTGGQFTPTALTVGDATTGITLTDPDHTHTVTSGAASIQTGYASVSIASTGGGEAHSHSLTGVSALPPFAALNFIIKT